MVLSSLVAVINVAASASAATAATKRLFFLPSFVCLFVFCFVLADACSSPTVLLRDIREPTIYHRALYHLFSSTMGLLRSVLASAYQGRIHASIIFIWLNGDSPDCTETVWPTKSRLASLTPTILFINHSSINNSLRRKRITNNLKQWLVRLELLELIGSPTLKLTGST